MAAHHQLDIPWCLECVFLRLLDGCPKPLLISIQASTFPFSLHVLTRWRTSVVIPCISQPHFHTGVFLSRRQEQDLLFRVQSLRKRIHPFCLHLTCYLNLNYFETEVGQLSQFAQYCFSFSTASSRYQDTLQSQANWVSQSHIFIKSLLRVGTVLSGGDMMMRKMDMETGSIPAPRELLVSSKQQQQ